MLKRIVENSRFGQTLILTLLCLFCVLASVFRYYYSNTFQFIFLNWNLFLAAVPWLLTSFISFRPDLQKNKILLFFLFCIWMLFFPNAPYILTDLIHLRLDSEMPIWFDLVFILSFSWAGLMFGFLSLMDLESFLKQHFSTWKVSLLSTFVLFFAAFGIYLGRYLELNSWDALREPFAFLGMMKKYFLTPLNHLDTWGLTLFMGAFLNLVFWSLKIIIKKKEVIKLKVEE